MEEMTHEHAKGMDHTMSHEQCTHEMTHEHANGMDHTMSHEQFAHEQLAQVLFPEIMTITAPRGDEFVLDVATGSGHLADVLVTKVAKGSIIGIDESDAMLQVAKEKTVNQGLSNYFPIKMKAEELIFKDGVFDLAFVVHAMHHFEDPVKALREVNRALKSGGNLVLCEPLGPRDERLRALLTEAFQAVHPDHKFFSPEQIDGFISESSFSEVKGTEIALAFHQQGIDAVPMGLRYLQAYNLIKLRKDSHLLEKFNEEVFQVSEGPEGVFIHGELTFLISLLEKKASE